MDFSDRDPRVGARPPVSPTAAQRGPLPAPVDDVFGPWYITAASRVQGMQWYHPDGHSTRDPDAVAPEHQCRTEILPSASQAPGPIRKTPPPVQAPVPVPGWPTEAR